MARVITPATRGYLLSILTFSPPPQTVIQLPPTISTAIRGTFAPATLITHRRRLRLPFLLLMLGCRLLDARWKVRSDLSCSLFFCTRAKICRDFLGLLVLRTLIRVDFLRRSLTRCYVLEMERYCY